MTEKKFPTSHWIFIFVVHHKARPHAVLMVNSLPLTASESSCLPPSSLTIFSSLLSLISAVLTSWWDFLIQFKTFSLLTQKNTHENTTNKLKLCADCNNMSTRSEIAFSWTQLSSLYVDCVPYTFISANWTINF